MAARTGLQARNGFDKLAGLYRSLEYLTFGPMLWRTRTAFLARMAGARQALVLGDGDGRFTAALLRSNRQVRVHAVDASAAMLSRLHMRAAAQGDASRLSAVHADATTTLPPSRFDLVCSHFFLDCLTEAECCLLADRVAKHMHPTACWVLSEFAIPEGRLRWPARLLLRGLYAAFGVLTGLRVKHLPDYTAALHVAGLQCIAVQTRLGGILRAEMWVLRPEEQTERECQTSNTP